MSAQYDRIEIDGDIPGQVAWDFYRDRSYFSGIMGCLGSGKTNTTIFKLLKMMEEQAPNAQGIRPTRLIAIRNTYSDLLTTTIKDWQAITHMIAPIRISLPPQQDLKWSLDDGTIVECNVLFIALDREEHVRKLRGTQATFIWLNEAKELVRAVLEMATRPLGRYPSTVLGNVRCTKSHMIADMNAPDEDHWTAEMIEHPEEGFAWFVQPGGVVEVADRWVLNPDAENLVNLPVTYYQDNLKHKRREWIRVNLANEYGSSVDGKPVYDEWNTHIHVGEFDVRDDVAILHGEDFGLTPACVMAQLVDGQLRVFDEIITNNMSARQLAESMHARKTAEWTRLSWGSGWCDPSGVAGSQADKNYPIRELQAAGFDAVGTTTNAFMPRRDAVGKRLRQLTMEGTPAVIVHPRCRVLAKGMAGHYKFERKRLSGDDAYHDVPHKNMYSHICEALQYLVLGVADIPDYETPYNDPSYRPNVSRRRNTGRGNTLDYSRNQR